MELFALFAAVLALGLFGVAFWSIVKGRLGRAAAMAVLALAMGSAAGALAAA